MSKSKFFFLPEVRGQGSDDCIHEDRALEAQEPKGKYPCPCCLYITLPNRPENAAAYICPVCFWKIDPFLASEDEPSDQNHGLSLKQARENYRSFGAVTRNLKKYCRPPLQSEYGVQEGKR